jgi:hypothetical protein
MKAMAYEVVNHGPEHEQYYQGCGTSLTDYDEVSTGIGENAKEAYLDALEGLYTMGIESTSLDKLLPDNPRGIRKTDRLTKEQSGPDYYWYVSIRVKTV